GHQDGGVTRRTIGTSMGASSVGIDGPFERHARDLGDLVDDRLRPDLVERDAAELGRVELPHDGTLLEHRNGDAAVGWAIGRDLGDGEVVPTHCCPSKLGPRTLVGRTDTPNRQNRTYVRVRASPDRAQLRPYDRPTGGRRIRWSTRRR